MKPDGPTVSASCPICDGDLKLATTIEYEYGEFGSVLAAYPVLTGDPDIDIADRDCNCDLTKPVMEAWAEYLSGDVYLSEMIEREAHPEQFRDSPMIALRWIAVELAALAQDANADDFVKRACEEALERIAANVGVEEASDLDLTA